MEQKNFYQLLQLLKMMLLTLKKQLNQSFPKKIKMSNIY